MRKEDCVEVFDRIPETIHAMTNLVLKNAVVIALDTVIRFEPHYMLVRGREGGSTDEGRSFFVPYEDIAYVKIEKVLRVNDLKRLYGEGSAHAETEMLTSEEQAASIAKETMSNMSLPDVTTPAPVQSGPMDPAAIAKQNLLDRIRNARTSTLSGIRPGSR